ncbi:hypothetical protein SDC9_171779 [bioreactor metagenome]|uniref:Uncharacterized protein n=1 Tax=bioreactor metagenome TaxID=1076179 RepID=A0A645GBW2_9ZZZZ
MIDHIGKDDAARFVALQQHPGRFARLECLIEFHLSGIQVGRRHFFTFVGAGFNAYPAILSTLLNKAGVVDACIVYREHRRPDTLAMEIDLLFKTGGPKTQCDQQPDKYENEHRFFFIDPG